MITGLVVAAAGPSAGHHALGLHWRGLAWTLVRLAGTGLGALAFQDSISSPVVGYALATAVSLVDVPFAVDQRMERHVSLLVLPGDEPQLRVAVRF